MSVKFKKGIGIVEVVIGSAITLVVVAGLIAVLNFYLKVSLSSSVNIQATALIEEGIEAIKILRDSGWDGNLKGIGTKSVHGLYFDGVSWSVVPNKEVVDGKFERSFYFDEVLRDAGGNISKNSGEVDPKTKFVTVQVSWFDKNFMSTTTKSMSFYLTNLFNN